MARKLEAKSPAAVRYTKDCVRMVRNMTKDQAADYLNAKSDALKHVDSPRSVAARRGLKVSDLQARRGQESVEA